MSVPGVSKLMTGAIQLGEERPGDRFRLFITARAQGSEMKFVGSLRPDPETGSLTTTIKDLPETSFDRMGLRFDGGRDALLATPSTCGPAGIFATFVPSNGAPPIARTGSVTIASSSGGACGPAPFSPAFSGGSTTARAGRTTSFTTTLRRRDGEQLTERLSVVLPAGMSAALGSVATCSAAAVTAGSCPATSRIGGAMAELGPGEDPARIEGDIFMTGPYRGAPFGFALAFKAKVGPFDLGTLVVRGSLRVDPLSGQVTIATDPLPTIFEGIPVRFQTIGLDLDRPGFVRNPTSCGASALGATVKSPSGAVAHLSSPFALTGCIDLPFHPRLSLALSDRGELHEGGRPGLKVSVRIPRGSANLRSNSIGLPRILKLDPAGLDEICARRAAIAARCPQGSRVGTAVGRTPVLNGQMRGSIYVVQPRGDGSPDLWASLAGEGVEINLKGTTTVKKGRSQASFTGIPDFPLTSIALRFGSGPNGLLKLRRKPCHSLTAKIELGGQNGARTQRNARLPVPVSCSDNG